MSILASIPGIIASGGAASPTIPTFTQRTLNISSSYHCNAVTYGCGYWVVGSNYMSQYIDTATDPTGTWTSSSQKAPVSRCSIACDGTYVTIGSKGGIMYTSDPTGAWTGKALPILSTKYANSVAAGDGYWVAGTSVYSLYTATSLGGTWTARTEPFTSTVDALCYDGSTYWVGGSSGGQIATTSDPTSTWTIRSNPLSTINNIKYGSDGYYVAVGGSVIATATDPTSTWTSRSNPFTASINAVAYDGSGLWIAVAEDGEMAWATDPTSTWTLMTSSFSTTDINDIHYADDIWVAVGDFGTGATGE